MLPRQDFDSPPPQENLSLVLIESSAGLASAPNCWTGSNVFVIAFFETEPNSCAQQRPGAELGAQFGAGDIAIAASSSAQIRSTKCGHPCPNIYLPEIEVLAAKGKHIFPL